MCRGKLDLIFRMADFGLTFCCCVLHVYQLELGLVYVCVCGGGCLCVFLPCCLCGEIRLFYPIIIIEPTATLVDP